ncbi:MAG: redox-regulated ATPase YchF [Planctomycetota bacterium]|nr:redox-regulated ATPase YchF [Planctomycetota bacterium]
MPVRCGIVGAPGCGTTTVFHLLAGSAAVGSAQEINRATVPVPDERLVNLQRLYRAARLVQATIEIVDLPGLAAGSTAGEGRGSKLLAHAKDADALIHVVRCFADETAPVAGGAIDARRDVEAIDLELMVADMQTLQNKIDRLAKRARVGDKEAQEIIADCEAIKETLGRGVPVRRQALTPRAAANVRDCHLVSQKPVLYIANLQKPADSDNHHVRALRQVAEAEGAPLVEVCGREEAEIARLEPSEQPAFLEALGIRQFSRPRVIKALYTLLGLVDFFTAGDKEVHAWTCRAGTKAPQAAGKIHTDFERGFIRMEVIRYTDLMAYGSEAAAARAGKQRVEGKDYEVQDGDVVFVRFAK